MSKNRISDLSALVKVLSRCPYLEVVRLSENPVCDKKVGKKGRGKKERERG
jgi:Ran GTPase-activating protein (RanGAP) involved in mRNA processing and transport